MPQPEITPHQIRIIVIGLLLFSAAVALVMRVSIRDRSLPMGVMAAALIVFYGIRAFGVALGVDDPYPQYLFSQDDLADTLESFGMMILLFCISMVTAYNFGGGFAALASVALPFPRRRLDISPLIAAMVVLTFIAAGIALLQISAYGGASGAISAAKSDRVSGGALMRIPATMALILSASLIYTARRVSDDQIFRRSVQVTSVICLATAALSASVWGSRQFLVLAVGYVVAAPAITAFRKARRGWLIRAVLTFALVVGLGFALRLYRDAALGGKTAISQAQGNSFRQISISSNGTTFDSSILAVRDFPQAFPYRGGDDFTNGLWGALPAQLRPATMQLDTVGATFHRLYEPVASNGWPIGAPTEWYINFGWIGVLFGGLLTGVVYRAIALGLRRTSMPELATMTVLVLTLVVFPLGVSSSSPNRFIVHVVPLLFLLGGLRLLENAQDKSYGGQLRAKRS